jgi:hypothetical protein
MYLCRGSRSRKQKKQTTITLSATKVAESPCYVDQAVPLLLVQCRHVNNSCTAKLLDFKTLRSTNINSLINLTTNLGMWWHPLYFTPAEKRGLDPHVVLCSIFCIRQFYRRPHQQLAGHGGQVRKHTYVALCYV